MALIRPAARTDEDRKPYLARVEVAPAVAQLHLLYISNCSTMPIVYEPQVIYMRMDERGFGKSV